MSWTFGDALWSGAGVVLLLGVVLVFFWLAVKRKPVALVVLGALVFAGPSLLQVDRTWLLQRLTDDWLPVLPVVMVVWVVLQLVTRGAVARRWTAARAR